MPTWTFRRGRSPTRSPLVEDLKADGLRADKQKDGFDIVTRGTAQPTHFNGEWKKQNMSQEAHMKRPSRTPRRRIRPCCAPWLPRLKKG